MLRLLVVVSLCASVFKLTAAECKDESTNLTYQTGDSVKVPGVCDEKVCQPNGFFASTGCAVYRASEGYHLTVEDPKLPFPECCSHPVPDSRPTAKDKAEDIAKDIAKVLF